MVPHAVGRWSAGRRRLEAARRTGRTASVTGVRHQDRSPWGPAAISLTFVVLAVGAYVRVGAFPGAWIVIGLAGLVAAWQAREAVYRYLAVDEDQDQDEDATGRDGRRP